MNWSDMTDAQIESDPSALSERASDYRGALLATEEGRRVFLDMQRMVDVVRDESRGSSGEAIEYLALSGFIAEVKHKCGLDDPMLVLRAEYQISSSYEPPMEAPEVKKDFLS